MTDLGQCDELVINRGKHDRMRCSFDAVVMRAGRRYCNAHAERVRAGREIDRDFMVAACLSACEGAEDPCPGELKRLREIDHD